MRNLKLKGFLALCLALCLSLPASAEEFVTNATYLGVKGHGTVTRQDATRKNFRGFRFLVEGEEKLFRIKRTPNFSIQNKLQHGESYNLLVESDMILRADALPTRAPTYTPPVKGKAKVKTVKNLLATAMEPIGTVLYIYGGGWNWQDKAGACDVQGFGIKDSWLKFFASQDASYNFKYVPGTGNKEIDRATSRYPFGYLDEYHYAGLDCSGYVAWVLDNVMPRQDGKQWVMDSTKFANALAEQGLGTVTKDVKAFKPGAIISIKGHIYICLGVCTDGSIVILHSTPSESLRGERGGGVQISAINPRDTGPDCEAYRLAASYMKRYFPKWSERYRAIVKDYKPYTNFTRAEETGIFLWASDAMPDPDGYEKMSAGEILKDLFCE